MKDATVCLPLMGDAAITPRIGATGFRHGSFLVLRPLLMVSAVAFNNDDDGERRGMLLRTRTGDMGREPLVVTPGPCIRRATRSLFPSMSPARARTSSGRNGIFRELVDELSFGCTSPSARFQCLVPSVCHRGGKDEEGMETASRTTRALRGCH